MSVADVVSSDRLVRVREVGAAGRAGVNVQLVPAAGGIVLRFAFSVVIENVGQAEVL